MAGSIVQQAGDKAVQFGQIGHVETISIDQRKIVDARKTIYVNCDDIGSIVGLPLQQQPVLQPRSAPVLLQPQPFQGLLDRQAAVQIAQTAIAQTQSLEFYGPAGIGKTVLLRHLAYDTQVVTQFPDGLVYLATSDRNGEDLLQTLFEAFYESNIALKPQSSSDFRHALQNKRALVLLDAWLLSSEAVNQFLQAIPGMTVIVASRQRRLWDTGQAVLLPGLPLEDALTLIEQDLRRSLSQLEQQAIKALWQEFDGNPLGLLQVVTKAQEDRRSLVAVGFPVFLKQLLISLTHPQRLILAVLAAMGGVALFADQVAAMTNLPSLEGDLADLVERHLVQIEGDRYSLSRNVVEVLRQEWDLTPWLERSLQSFTDWATQYRQDPQQILRNVDAFEHLLRWGVEQARWPEVLQLARSLEGALILSRRWHLWQEVLQWGLQAAQALGDRAAEALMLHELGTRALCLDDWATAQTDLTEALKIRESLHDSAGVEATRHNLQYLWSLVRSSDSEAEPPLDLSPILPFLTGTIFALLLGIGGWLWSVPTSEPPPSPTPSSAITPSPATTPPTVPASASESPLTSPSATVPTSSPSASPTSLSPSTEPTSPSPDPPSPTSPSPESPSPTSPSPTTPSPTSPSPTTPSPTSPSPEEQPPATELARFYTKPDEVSVGQKSTGVVVLNSPATEDIVVAIANSNPELADMPGEVIIVAGESSSTFSISTQPALQATQSSSQDEPTIVGGIVEIQATYGDQTLSTKLLVRPSEPPSFQTNTSSFQTAPAGKTSISQPISSP